MEGNHMLDLGETVSRVESCSVAVARRVAAMLDLDPGDIAEGSPLPRGWHFVLLGADTRRGALRGDGFPGLGVPMPDLGLPRLVLGGRQVSYLKGIAIGTAVMRTSSIQSVRRKTSAAGPMAVATILHELRTLPEMDLAIAETQTYLLLPAREGAAVEVDTAPSSPVVDDWTATIVPDETLLFQYSALGFNSHKIHIDKTWAREVEGYPDLVVNGGLATLILTEFLRKDLCVAPALLKVRHVAPLFCGRQITLAAHQEGAAWRVRAFNDRGRLAIDMEVEAG
jgi:3-methylfumaryl-CoA hydratase